jgi:hypothetical protein
MLGLEEDAGPEGAAAGLEVLHLLGKVVEALEPVEEPLVDLGQLPDPLDRVASGHSVGDGKEALVGRGL